jgi:hypothetical protein
MKRTILCFACGLVAPLAFAQTSSPTTQSYSSGSTTQTTDKASAASSTANGTVSSFTPGSTMSVNSDTGGSPTTYAIGTNVRFVDSTGKEIDVHLVKPGAKVHVIYDRDGDNLIARRVIVDQD